ncbi:MAG: hypothetical protein ACTSYO_03815, partial [Candidatus Ranarchaeia archaeon]
AGTDTLIVAVGREQFKFGFFLNLLARTAYKIAEIIAAPTKQVPDDQPLIEYAHIPEPAAATAEPKQPAAFIPSGTPAPATGPPAVAPKPPAVAPKPAAVAPSTAPPPQSSIPMPVPGFAHAPGKEQPKLDKEEERKAILEALKVIGMIGEEPEDN